MDIRPSPEALARLEAIDRQQRMPLPPLVFGASADDGLCARTLAKAEKAVVGSNADLHRSARAAYQACIAAIRNLKPKPEQEAG